jgi:hypothetical protein
MEWIPEERRKRRSPRKTWMEGVQAAMTARNWEQDQTGRNGVWFPEDGDSCYKTGKTGWHSAHGVPSSVPHYCHNKHKLIP